MRLRILGHDGKAGLRVRFFVARVSYPTNSFRRETGGDASVRETRDDDNARKLHRPCLHRNAVYTGRSGDPTYAGALSFMRRRYTKNVKGADAVVWGIPFDAAVTNRPGARFGPQAIRRASAIFDADPQYPFNRDLFETLAVVDYGDCLLDYGNHQKTPATIEREAASC